MTVHSIVPAAFEVTACEYEHRRSIGMHRDATVAATGHGDGERDQLADLRPEPAGRITGGTECHITLERVGREPAQITNAVEQVAVVRIPIDHRAGRCRSCESGA